MLVEFSREAERRHLAVIWAAYVARMAKVFFARARDDRGGWRLAIGLICAVMVGRLIYQYWLSPWELVGDEAYYWVQGQHADWCYNEKGALFPLLIRLSCVIFGNTQFAVRLPVLLGSTIGAFLLLDLTHRVAAEGRRGAAGLIAVALFILSPAIQANAQISTQDGLLIPWTLAMTTIGLCLVRRWVQDKNTWALWIAWWGLLGVGMHLRFSAPLLFTAPICFMLLQRRELRIGLVLLMQQLVGLAIFSLILSPIVIWNARHGWPTFEHTAGHLGLGGDQAGHVSTGNPLVWFGNTIGGVVGAYGPVLLFTIWASWRSVKTRMVQPQREWIDQSWLLCATWPSVAFFVALSFIKPVIASWPLPSVVPALALAAVYIDQKELFSSTSPKWFEPMWRATLGYGIVGALLLMFPTALTYVPFVGARLGQRIAGRLQGHAALASKVQRNLDADRGPESPMIVASYYDMASLLWFYLPDHPIVHVASHRLSTYDNWPDTRLNAASLAGKRLLLVGHADTAWSALLSLDDIQPTADPEIQLARYIGGQLTARAAVAGASAGDNR